MPSGKSTYWANHLLDLVAGAVAFSAPANSYIALYSVAPTAGGGGTEAAGSGYARAANTNNGTTWGAAAGGIKANAVAFNFAPATGDWSGAANQVAAALLDALTLGNFIYFGSLTVAKPVLNGDTASFAIGAISITET